MAWRTRIAAFGSTMLMVIAGAVCAAAFSDDTGHFVGYVLIGVGLTIATGLVFLEVGFSEDRERARERDAALGERPARSGRLKPRRLERSRGHRRRPG
jgi:hypothetical protein